MLLQHISSKQASTRHAAGITASCHAMLRLLLLLLLFWSVGVDIKPHHPHNQKRHNRS
jgi:hypothetical protein